MTIDPYPDISHTDRLEVNRLRFAAKRGDKRAEATLTHLEQQKHDEAWQAAETKRQQLVDERAERNKQRPTSVEGTMDRLRKARDDKEARRKASLDEA